MTELLLDVRHQPKDRAYALVHASIAQLLSGIDDEIATMATMASILHHGFGFLWTGFYRVTGPDLLRVGPYQGTVGCLEIPFGKGVCGTAAAERRTVIVPDVRRFPGHITCDEKSRSEIVVPAVDRNGRLIAVLDIDSDRTNTFDRQDQEGIERIMTWFARP
jgi:L-methionine (R)-S-oxide reductase